MKFNLLKSAVLSLILLGAHTLGASATQTVTLKTNTGEIKLLLDAEHSPQTVNNFLDYARSGAYNGTIFHRVIPQFMIQGGGFDEHLNQIPTNAPVNNESANGLSNRRGTVAMARTSDPHSATSQFFINLVDNDRLDYGAQGTDSWGYAVFAEVIEGMDLLEQLQNVPTARVGGHQHVPTTPIIVQSVEISTSTE